MLGFVARGEARGLGFKKFASLPLVDIEMCVEGHRQSEASARTALDGAGTRAREKKAALNLVKLDENGIRELPDLPDESS